MKIALQSVIVGLTVLTSLSATAQTLDATELPVKVLEGASDCANPEYMLQAITPRGETVDINHRGTILNKPKLLDATGKLMKLGLSAQIRFTIDNKLDANGVFETNSLQTPNLSLTVVDGKVIVVPLESLRVEIKEFDHDLALNRSILITVTQKTVNGLHTEIMGRTTCEGEFSGFIENQHQIFPIPTSGIENN
ncbi:MAG: hypothetical protein EOP04_07805 [Proteobacteria bacterium]|nr:MAG: hypothetical protein EOP04_07805 [Pseudomonadota bacterium]